jgi:hypothetical protein
MFVHRYIGRKTDEVDNRMLKICLPDTFTRNPRSITQRKFWKGEFIRSYSGK